MKIKQMSRWLLLCLLIVGTLFQAQPVRAAEKTYDAEKKGSIKVCLDDIGTEFSSVSLYCYYVGEAKLYENHLEGWVITEDYKDLGIDLNKLGDTSVHREAAERLSSFVEENGEILPIQKGVTNSNGECMFSELSQGVYLIVQKDGFESYGTTEPFLMTVPYIEDDIFVYDVVTQTKGEKPVPPTETETEPNPPQTETQPPDEPTKTGDNKPITAVAAIGFISAAGICVVLWRKNQKAKQ